MRISGWCIFNRSLGYLEFRKYYNVTIEYYDEGVLDLTHRIDIEFINLDNYIQLIITSPDLSKGGVTQGLPIAICVVTDKPQIYCGYPSNIILHFRDEIFPVINNYDPYILIF